MSEKINKLTEEELKSIQDQQGKLNTILQEIGVLETKKHAFLHDIANTNEDINEFKKSLEEKYGSITIDLADGSFKSIEKESVEDKKD
tara:strand:- start:1004 stop:1267 length:264 start_codon:yes stop_codon:yes gene_type:complete